MDSHALLLKTDWVLPSDLPVRKEGWVGMGLTLEPLMLSWSAQRSSLGPVCVYVCVCSNNTSHVSAAL